jgi:predicted deacylase
MAGSEMLIDAVAWESHGVAATAATGDMQVRVGRVGTGSPVGLLVASQHGDEGPWGTRAIRKLLETTPLADLVGSLRIVPVANPLAFEGNTRESRIDGEDLNSCFPGDPEGRHTERLAYMLATKVVDGCDVVIDVHGGGSWCINCFVYRFPGSHDLADWIAGPFVRDGLDRTNSLTGYARERGAKAVWIEMGGAGANEERWAERIALGMRRALGKSGVLTDTAPAGEPSVFAGPSKVLRAKAPGLYLPVLKEDAVATVVAEGSVIGHLIDHVTGDVIETYRAPFERTAMTLLRPTIAVIEGGEMIAALSGLT